MSRDYANNVIHHLHPSSGKLNQNTQGNPVFHGMFGTPLQQSVPFPVNYPLSYHPAPQAVRNRTQYSCPNCSNISFPNIHAFNKHKSSHITCKFPGCTFTASPKVVSHHYTQNHGKYAGQGLKNITIDIPGCRPQRFKICVGNHPSDIEKWIEERKKNFPTKSRIQEKLNSAKKPVTSSLPNTDLSKISSLMAGYESSSDDDDQDTTCDATLILKRKLEKVQKENEQTETVPQKKKICSFFARGVCRKGEKCTFLHNVNNKEQTLQFPQQQKQPIKTWNNKRNSLSHNSTLLRKLLDKEIHRESFLTLQCLKFLEKQNYFASTSK